MTTLEQYRTAARNYIASNDKDALEQVAQFAHREQCGVWHAATVIGNMDRVRRAVPCELCGGPRMPTEPPHALCQARAARGVVCTPLDSARRYCSCATCNGSVPAAAQAGA